MTVLTLLNFKVLLCRDQIHVYQEPFLDQTKDSCKNFFFRMMFKPQDGSLWGFHQMHSSIENLISYHKNVEGDQQKEEEENEVDLSKTMWLVLRKKEAINDVLKNFNSSY